jgi:hypothetical protein
VPNQSVKCSRINRGPVPSTIKIALGCARRDFEIAALLPAALLPMPLAPYGRRWVDVLLLHDASRRDVSPDFRCVYARSTCCLAIPGRSPLGQELDARDLSKRLRKRGTFSPVLFSRCRTSSPEAEDLGWRSYASGSMRLCGYRPRPNGRADVHRIPLPPGPAAWFERAPNPLLSSPLDPSGEKPGACVTWLSSLH